MLDYHDHQHKNLAHSTREQIQTCLSSDKTNTQNFSGNSQEDTEDTTVCHKKMAVNRKKQITFQCRYCDKKFRASVNRSKHEKAVHLEEKSHKCRFCVKSFGRVGHRNIHEKTVHLKEKPHKCRFCEKTFCEGGNRNVHEKKFHRCSTTTGNTVCSEPSPSSSVAAPTTASSISTTASNVISSIPSSSSTTAATRRSAKLKLTRAVHALKGELYV